MTFHWRLCFVAIAAIAGLPAGAASAADTDDMDAADPDARVPKLHYRPVLRDYRASPITTQASDWREMNDRAEAIGGPRGQLRSVDEPIRKRQRN